MVLSLDWFFLDGDEICDQLFYVQITSQEQDSTGLDLISQLLCVLEKFNVSYPVPIVFWDMCQQGFMSAMLLVGRSSHVS